VKVFVAGATGVIGRALVPALLDAGHAVTGTTRSPERAAALETRGATAAVCDALDREGLARAVTGAAPDAVVHALSDLPARYDKLAQDVGATNRLRTEGTRNLVDAAAGARLVATSIAFLYAPEGAAIQDEDGRPWTDAPAPLDATIRALLELERTVTAAQGIVLRLGWLYGPGTWFAPGGDVARRVRRRLFPIVGDGGGINSWLHVDDAAAAILRALETGSPGVYNVVDDTPVAFRDWLPEYARALGAPRPLRVPAWLARLAAGRLALATMTTQRGATNARARRELGWAPQYRDWRAGFGLSAP
jgi:nucleoside-diphosphate-sugar epimerase